MPVDAHIHFANLFERDPGFPGRFASLEIAACGASHHPDEFVWSEAFRDRLRAGGGIAPRLSYGLHPQGPDMGHADFLAVLARSGRIDMIGEAGFDFFGDRPEFTRGPDTLAIQRRAFEFQLGLALETGLPLLVHLRKAMDLAFEYAKALSKLPAVIFHSWPGGPLEALGLLDRGIKAYFSFGAIIMNGHKRAIASLAAIPPSTILSETDAPWQPPRGAAFCRFEDLGPIVASMAAIRRMDAAALDALIAGNWARAFGTKP